MRNSYASSPRRAGFTLVELIMVIAVIGILAALLLPVLATARRKARQAQCRSNLHQIGIAVLAYTADYAEHLPVAGRLGPEPMFGWPSLPVVLGPSLAKSGVFHCPEDTAPGTALYPEFGTSYEWNTFLNGKLIERATLRVIGLEISGPMLGDGDAFHLGEHRNYLYLDGHVKSSLEILIHEQ